MRNPEEEEEEEEEGDDSSAKESVFSGFVLDPEKCSHLTLEEKRELVHEIAQWSKDAPKILCSWTRPELLEIICAEMGQKRKYTGFTKTRMIDHLLKLVSGKSGAKNYEDNLPFPRGKTHSGSKKQRRKEHPEQLFSDSNHGSKEISGEEKVDTILCQNLACKAILTPKDPFCKRCSCCICYHYDENKDPSLWLTCGFDSCGRSCHLTCALKHERAGIVHTGSYAKLDGAFYCVSCGKINDLMGCWRKQLLVAKDARRVDVLCTRISLAHKILKGTERYKEQQRFVDTAVKMLKSEVGPFDRVPTKMARGIVNRLSCGAEIQKLCSSAIDSIDSMLSGMNHVCTSPKNLSSSNIRFKETSSTSVVVLLEFEDKLLAECVGCRLWHRKSAVTDYPDRPTFIVLRPQKKFPISELDPSTEYSFKVSLFSSTREIALWEAKYVTGAAPNGSSISGLYEEHGKEEQTCLTQSNSHRDSTNSSDNQSKVRSLDDINKKDEHHVQHSAEGTPLTGSTSLPPSTPCKSDGTQEVPTSGGKKQMAESNYEYCVRVIRWLEREGHMEKDFRVRFLTWFSLKATTQEKRVVSAFVDTMIDDPPSLAGQLVHTFTDEICIEQKPIPPKGFCTRLWH